MIVSASTKDDGLVIETVTEENSRLLLSVVEFITRYKQLYEDDKVGDDEVEFAEKLVNELLVYLIEENDEAEE